MGEGTCRGGRQAKIGTMNGSKHGAIGQGIGNKGQELAPPRSHTSERYFEKAAHAAAAHTSIVVGAHK
jgi:hypothetical protein